MEGKLTTGDSIEDRHALKRQVHNIEDDWRLEEIEVVQVLKK